MRCHKVEQALLCFGVAEAEKWDQLGLLDAHKSPAVDCRRQFPLIADAPQSAGLLPSGINPGAGAEPSQKDHVGGNGPSLIPNRGANPTLADPLHV
jgi:hypothetical protein